MRRKMINQSPENLNQINQKYWIKNWKIDDNYQIVVNWVCFPAFAIRLDMVNVEKIKSGGEMKQSGSEYDNLLNRVFHLVTPPLSVLYPVLNLKILESEIDQRYLWRCEAYHHVCYEDYHFNPIFIGWVLYWLRNTHLVLKMNPEDNVLCFMRKIEPEELPEVLAIVKPLKSYKDT